MLSSQFRRRLIALGQTKYRLRFQVGPTAVKEIADAIRKAGFMPTEGTEHILVDVEGEDAMDAEQSFLDDLRKVHKKDFGLKSRGTRKL